MYSLVITGEERPDYLSKLERVRKVRGPIQLNTLHVMADRFFRSGRNNDLLVKTGILRSVFDKSIHDQKQLYRRVDAYYGRCVKTLFQPSEEVTALVRRYERLLGDGIRIGVHIRMGQGKSDWVDSRRFLDQSDVDNLMTKLKELIARYRRRGNSSVKIFLSTDSSQEEIIMRKKFPGMVVTTKQFKRSHVGGVRATKYTEESVLKAVLDQMLLGKCDFLFLTPRSGFSKMGLYYAEENTPFRFIWRLCWH